MSGYVLLPQPIQKEATRLLEQAGITYVVAEGPQLDKVKRLMKGAAAVVLRTGLRMTAELMDEAKELLTVSRTGAGYDNVEVDAATKRGIIVTSSIGVNTTSVTEHTVSLLLALFKQLIRLDQEVRAGNFRVRYQNYPRDLKNKMLGLVGFGRIGEAVAEICMRAFGMRIQVYDPYLSDGRKMQFSRSIDFVDAEKLFKTSDAISIHVPLNADTRGMVDKRLLGLMMKSAFLINTSRGGVVREDHLSDELRSRNIAGAGLDVFEQEPLPPDSELLGLDNVILTPHTAALTEECVMEMALSAVQRVIDVLKGKCPKNVVNPDVLSFRRWEHLIPEGRSR